MSCLHDAIRLHLLRRVGIEPPDPRFSYESLKRTEWSPRFERLMRNRMVIGAYRYGLLNAARKIAWNRVKYILTKLERYVKTGNLECLVDIANLCLLEFEEGQHPKRHFGAMDDTEEHCGTK